MAAADVEMPSASAAFTSGKPDFDMADASSAKAPAVKPDVRRPRPAPGHESLASVAHALALEPSLGAPATAQHPADRRLPPPRPQMYAKMKSLQQMLEFVEIQEEYIKDEIQNLKREHVRAKEEVKRIQSVPLVIGQFLEIIDNNHGIVSSTAGSNYYVRVLSTINREQLKPSSSVALHRHSNAVVDVLPPEADSSIALMGADERPDVSYSDIGGCDIQKQAKRATPNAHNPPPAPLRIAPPVRESSPPEQPHPPSSSHRAPSAHRRRCLAP